jgi:hypothetical protein
MVWFLATNRVCESVAWLPRAGRTVRGFQITGRTAPQRLADETPPVARPSPPLSPATTVAAVGPKPSHFVEKCALRN